MLHFWHWPFETKNDDLTLGGGHTMQDMYHRDIHLKSNVINQCPPSKFKPNNANLSVSNSYPVSQKLGGMARQLKKKQTKMKGDCV